MNTEAVILRVADWNSSNFFPTERWLSVLFPDFDFQFTANKAENNIKLLVYEKKLNGGYAKSSSYTISGGAWCDFIAAELKHALEAAFYNHWSISIDQEKDKIHVSREKRIV